MDKDQHSSKIIELMGHSAPRRTRTVNKQSQAPKIQGHGNITGDVQINNSTVMLGADINCGLAQRITELERAVRELRTDLFQAEI